MAGQAGSGGAGKATHVWRRLAWGLVVLAQGLALSACGLEGLKNPSTASSSGAVATPASVLSLFAGGTAGAGLANGDSLHSRFALPQGAVSDGHGHVYIADTDNNVIRLMKASGTGINTVWTTQTLVGGNSSSPTASGSTDTTVDANNMPVTGSAPALFYHPMGLALDRTGQTDPTKIDGTVLYVADFGNSTIRKIELKTLASGTDPAVVVSTIAGTAQVARSDPGVGSAAKFNGPVDVAIGAARQELYVSDWGNNEIRRVNLAKPADLYPCKQTPPQGVPASAAFSGSPAEAQYNVTLVAGHTTSTSTSGSSSIASIDGTGSQASFNGPEGLAVDAAGNIYVADSNSDTIRKIVMAPATDLCAGVLDRSSNVGTVTTLSGVSGSSGAADTYFTSTVTTTYVTSVDPTAATGVEQVVTTTKTLGTVANPGSSVVLTPVPSYFANKAGLPLTDSKGTTSSPIVVNSIPMYNGPASLTLDAKCGLVLSPTPANPKNEVLDPGCNLLISDSGNDVVRQFNLNTNVLTTVVGIPPTTSGGSVATNTTYYPGNADTASGVPAQVNHPRGITYDSQTQMVILADAGNNRIRQITDGGSWVVKTIAGASSGFSDGLGAAAGFNNPQGIGFDAGGNAYVADSGNNSIRWIDGTGNVTTLAGQSGDVGGYADGIGTAALFNSPTGLAVDSGSGAIYVADTGNNTIRVMTATGTGNSKIWTTTTLAGSINKTPGSADGLGTAASFRGPTALALDGLGHLYVADSGNHTIRQITLASGQVLTIAGVAGSSGSFDTVGGPALFDNPQGLVAKGGVIYVADTDNDTIRVITVPASASAGSGVVTTLVGTVQAPGSVDGDASKVSPSFNKPTGLALDSSGNLFVADHDNQTVREIVPATATKGLTVSTVAGIAGADGFDPGQTVGLLSFPAGLASYGGSLYITMSDSVISMSNLP